MSLHRFPWRRRSPQIRKGTSGVEVLNRLFCNLREIGLVKEGWECVGPSECFRALDSGPSRCTNMRIAVMNLAARAALA